MMQKQSQAKRMQTYFGNRDVKSIDTLDIEEFFKWCRSPQPGFPQSLSNNSIQKIRTQLYQRIGMMMETDPKFLIL